VGTDQRAWLIEELDRWTACESCCWLAWGWLAGSASCSRVGVTREPPDVVVGYYLDTGGAFFLAHGRDGSTPMSASCLP